MKIFQKYCNSVRSFKEIPGPYSAPIIGTLYQYLPVIGYYQFDKLEINGLKKLRKFGEIVREEIVPGTNILWLFNPNDIEKALKNDINDYPRRISHLALQKYRLDRPNVYNTGGLLPTNGPEWKRIRSAFQKGLSSPNDVEKFLTSTNSIIQEWIDLRLPQIINQPQLDYLPEISRLFLERTAVLTVGSTDTGCTTNVISLRSRSLVHTLFFNGKQAPKHGQLPVIGFVALDIRLDSFTSPIELQDDSRSTKLLESALITNSCILKTDNGPQIWRKFETPLYKKLRKAQEFMESVAIDLLSFKMCTFKEKTTSNSTLLEIYLANNTIDFKDIIGMVCDFFLAGMDTTSYSTSFLLYYLAKNPEKQDELYKESLNLLKTPNDIITSNKYKNANYAKACLKETLRLRPISVGIGRLLNKDMVLSGYQIPRDTIIVTQNQVICRLEKYFKDAHRFEPERWLDPNQKYHPYLLLPFGYGTRTCIARRFAEQNMIVLMLKLVRQFEIRWNGGFLDTKSLLINKPDRPVTLVLRKR